MGCGASKAAAVVAPALEQTLSKPPDTQDITSSRALLTGSRQKVKVRQRKSQSGDALQSDSTSTLNLEAEYDAQASEVTSTGSRNSSATSGKSKDSSSSGDSGLGEECTQIITEKSDVALQETANISEDLKTPNLSINGLAVNKKVRLSSIGSDDSENNLNRPLPNGHKHVKFAEKLIGELPDSPSILKRPASRGGMAFDVVVGDTLSPQKPVFSSSTKRRKRLTIEELREKQRMVEQRKKEREQMIIERIRAKEERDRQVREALEKFAEMQTELANIKQKKEEKTYENREAYLNSIRDKLKEKSDHVDDVRTAKKAKKLTPINRPPRPTIGRQDNPVNLGAN